MNLFASSRQRSVKKLLINILLYIDSGPYSHSLTMTTKQKILEDVHPLTIIREVQKWPVLYTRDARDRGNKAFKFRVWREVTETLFDGWNTFDDKEKDNRVNEVMRRWRNLRDTFKRQLETDKKVKEGLEPKKKQYIYFKDMEFLLPHMTSEEETPASAERSSSEGSSKRRLEQHLPEEVSVSVSAPKVQRFTCVHEEVDEDRHFVLSLIPTLKKLSDEDKLTTKMEVLKVLRDASKRSSRNSDSQIMFVNENATDNLKCEYMDDDAIARAISESISCSLGWDCMGIRKAEIHSIENRTLY